MPELADPDADNCEFLVLIPKSAGELGDSTGESLAFCSGGIWTLSFVPNKTILLLGLEQEMLFSLKGSSLGVSSISATLTPFESNLSKVCLFSEKTFGDLGWFESYQSGFLKGGNGLVVSIIEVGLITGSVSGRPLNVKALNLGEPKKDAIGFVQNWAGDD